MNENGAWNRVKRVASYEEAEELKQSKKLQGKTVKIKKRVLRKGLAFDVMVKS